MKEKKIRKEIIKCWGPLLDQNLVVWSQPKESEKEKERERERKKDTGTQTLIEQRCFISRNAGLYIFSKMITQLLHRMKFYQ